jgi:SAM-dependent methyltransferase
MMPTHFEWTPEFWQGWRESSNPYRKFKSERDRQLVLESLELRDGDRVLEVGCGYGWISQALWQAANIEWTGVDGSPEMVQRMISAHPDRAERVMLADACQLPFKDGEFDKVLCTGVLMHIRDYAAAVQELMRVVRPGGLLLCSINNALSPISLPVRLWNLRKRGFVQKFQWPGSIRRMLRQGGVAVNAVRGDGILATAPVTIGSISFPPASACRLVCKWDLWAVERMPWLAYEVWFRGAKGNSPCAY